MADDRLTGAAFAMVPISISPPKDLFVIDGKGSANIISGYLVDLEAREAKSILYLELAGVDDELMELGYSTTTKTTDRGTALDISTKEARYSGLVFEDGKIVHLKVGLVPTHFESMYSEILIQVLKSVRI